MQFIKLTVIFGNIMGSIFSKRIQPVTPLQCLYCDV